MNYDEMNIQSLRAECKKLGISSAQKKKSEMVVLLKAHRGVADRAGDGKSEGGERKHPFDKNVRIHSEMTEEEKIEARRKRFGLVEVKKRTEEDTPQKTSEDSMKAEERRKRFGSK